DPSIGEPVKAMGMLEPRRCPRRAIGRRNPCPAFGRGGHHTGSRIDQLTGVVGMLLDVEPVAQPACAVRKLCRGSHVPHAPGSRTAVTTCAMASMTKSG